MLTSYEIAEKLGITYTTFCRRRRIGLIRKPDFKIGGSNVWNDDVIDDIVQRVKKHNAKNANISGKYVRLPKGYE